MATRKAVPNSLITHNYRFIFILIRCKLVDLVSTELRMQHRPFIFYMCKKVQCLLIKFKSDIARNVKQLYI